MTPTPATILVVDDDPGLVVLIERALREEKWRVATATSGREALAWLERHPADLLLLDLKLNDLGGREFIGALGKGGRPVPFIIITGQGDERVAVDMMKRGALDYLVKDINFIEFLPTVVRLAFQRLREEQKLIEAQEARQQAEAELIADLDAMTRLQRLGTLYVRNGEMEPVLIEIVDAAVAIAHADFGGIQLVNAGGDLEIVIQRGFPDWWVQFWNTASAGHGTCGKALETRQRVIVEDVESSPVFVGTQALEIQRRAGVRAVQSTPLVGRSGKLLGVLSTHFKVPHRPDGRTLQFLDLLARHAADIIERQQAEESLRASLAELERFNQLMVGRELRMVELKKEVNEWCARLGRPAAYAGQFLQEEPAPANPAPPPHSRKKRR